VIASSQALLVLNDAWAPGWRATLDGRSVEILPANYMARGVWVPAGRHEVRFRYRTPGLDLGVGTALSALACLAAAWGVGAARKRRTDRSQLSSPQIAL
jgi:uncharacterized membrane protein YfhO